MYLGFLLKSADTSFWLKFDKIWGTLCEALHRYMCVCVCFEQQLQGRKHTLFPSVLWFLR